MKYFILCIVLFLPQWVSPQSSITRTQGTGYYIQTQEGDTLQLRGATPIYSSYRLALEDALNYSGQLDGQEVFVRSNIKDRVRAEYIFENIITRIDTIEVARDTVHIEQTEMLGQLSSTIKKENESNSFIHEIGGQAFADFLKFVWWCGDEEIGSYSEQFLNGSFMTELPIACGQDIRFKITAESRVSPDVFKVAVHEETIAKALFTDTGGPSPQPSYKTDFENYNSRTWTLLWGTAPFGVQKIRDRAMLFVQINERETVRVQWEEVPKHDNIWFSATELMDASHTTGLHYAFRTSSEAEVQSIEVYHNSEGRGISIFKDGQWTNPITYPMDWRQGDLVTTEVHLRDDTIRTRSWVVGTPVDELPEFKSYQSNVIGDMVPGYFTIGATGAGTYILDRVVLYFE